MEEKINEDFENEKIEVINERSIKDGNKRDGGNEEEKYEGEGEKKLRIRIVEEDLKGMSRVKRKREINDILKEEMERGVKEMEMEN